jgi:hypothetical protein
LRVSGVSISYYLYTKERMKTRMIQSRLKYLNCQIKTFMDRLT